MIGDTSGLFTDDDPRTMLAGIMSPTSAAELVGPPPDSPPPHEAGRTTPLTGTLAAAPREAVAKNMDTALGRTAYNTRMDTGNYDPRDPAQMDTRNAVPGAARMTLASNAIAPQNATGTSNPPNGGYVNSISQAQPVQQAQQVRPAQQVQPTVSPTNMGLQNSVRPAPLQPGVPLAAQQAQRVQAYNSGPGPAMYAASQSPVSTDPRNPDPTASLRPGGSASGVTQVQPATAPTQVQGPSALDTAQSRLANLTNSGPGWSQIKNPVGRIAAGIGSTALSAILPGLAPLIPGTTAHNQQLLGRQQDIVGNLQGQQTAAAQQQDIEQQGRERAALGEKASALAASDQPMTPTAEQAAAVGHPEIANLPIPPRTYSAMLVAKERADAAEKVGAGHDTARVAVGQGNNATSAANNAATNATRLATSKYGPGNKGAGAGTGAEIPVSQPGDLSGVPANVRGLVQAIGEGREGPAPLGRKDGKEIMRLVSQVYPDYDASQFHNYQATRAEFSKGPTGRAINSFNTALQHIGRMEGNLPHNTGLPVANWVINTGKDLLGSAANTPFEADRIAVAGEIGKAYKGGVLTKDENEQYQKLLDRDASPAQQKANLAELKGLLGGKLNSFNEQYKTGLPTGATRGFQVVSPEAAAVLNGGAQAPSGGNPSGKEVSLAAARALPQNKGKSDADIRADIQAHGHRVKE